MADLLLVGTAVVFFASAALYVRACAAIVGSPPAGETDEKRDATVAP